MYQARHPWTARLAASLPLSFLVALAALQGGGCGSGIDEGDIEQALGSCAEPLTDGGPCMTVRCTSGVVVHEQATDGTACKTSSARDGYCYAGACLSCSDGIQNGDETGVDCGGHCGQCNGARCNGPAECYSGFCVDGVCCETACDGMCMACNVEGSEGQCHPVRPFVDDPGAGCARTAKFACDGKGVCLALNGGACDTDSDCISGSCGPTIKPTTGSSSPSATTVCKGKADQPCTTPDACSSSVCTDNSTCQ